MYKYILLVLFVVLTSCANNSQTKKVENISELSPFELFFQEIPIEPLLHKPYQMEIIDSILILADNIENRALLLYNLEDASFVRALSIGQGPNDVLSPIAIDVDENEQVINILQRQNGKCRKYKLKELISGCIQDCKSVDLGNSDRFTQIKNGYACIGFYEDALVTFFDESGKLESSLDLYTEYKFSDIATKYKLFQGRIAFHNVSGCLMLAPSYASVVRFFLKDNEAWVQTDSFCIGNKKMENRILNEKIPILHKSDIRYCIDICKSNNYFYMLYDGDDLGHNQNLEARYVLRFDAFGSLDCVYKVNPTICDICVSEGDNIIYAVMIGKDGEYVLAKSQLKTILL